MSSPHPWIASYPPALRWDSEIGVRPVPQILDEACARWPDRAAIDFMGRQFSYSEVGDLVARAAKGLQALGVGPGVHVGLYLANTPHYLISFFAVLKAGGVVVNYSPLDAEKVLEHKIGDSQTDVLITLDFQALYPQMDRLLASTRLKTLVVGTLGEMTAHPAAVTQQLRAAGQLSDVSFDERHRSFASLLANDGRYQPHDIGDPREALAVLQYTGGTTGLPKGAMLTHGNLSAANQQYWLTCTYGGADLQEGAERRGEAQDKHQAGNRHHDQQCERGEHLPQSGRMDVAEDRPGQVDASENDPGDGAQCQQRHPPGGQRLDQAPRVLDHAHGRCACGRTMRRGRFDRFCSPRDGQQRQQRQHRDHRDVLGQQNRKGRAAAGGLHQALFCQGLQHDCRRRKRQGEADGQRNAPAEPDQHASSHHGRGGGHDLQPAQPEKLVPHRPERAGVELETDQEKHHHHAEFGEMLEIVSLVADKPQDRPDDQARQQIPQHRAEAEPRRQRNGRHRGGEVDHGLKQEAFHPLSIRRVAPPLRARA